MLSRFSPEFSGQFDRVPKGIWFGAMAVRNNDMRRVLAFLLNISQSGFIRIDIGIAQVAEVLGIGSFNKAATIQYFFMVKPHHNVVFGVAFARVIGFESIPTNLKTSIRPN